jgi:DNA-binding transcriptional ArsR family regulator
MAMAKTIPAVKRRNDFNAELAKILGHWIRLKAWSIFAEREASTSEVADTIGEPVSNVAYHVRMLRDLGWIEEVRSEQRRGAVEHYYRATHRPMLDDEAVAELDPLTRDAAASMAIEGSFADAMAAVRGGTITARDELHLSRTPMLLDEEGWKNVSKVFEETFERLMDAQAESDERRSQSGEEGIPVSASILYFEMPSKAQQSAPAAKKNGSASHKQ